MEPNIIIHLNNLEREFKQMKEYIIEEIKEQGGRNADACFWDTQSTIDNFKTQGVQLRDEHIFMQNNNWVKLLEYRI